MVPIRYNIRSLLQRRATSLMTILGVALVSMIFVIVFGFSAGLRQSLLNTGEDRPVAILGHSPTKRVPCAAQNAAPKILTAPSSVSNVHRRSRDDAACQRRTKTASVGRSKSTSVGWMVLASGRGSARGISPSLVRGLSSSRAAIRESLSYPGSVGG